MLDTLSLEASADESSVLTVSAGDNAFVIRNIRMIRETIHESKVHKDVLLHLTQIRELEVLPQTTVSDKQQAVLKSDKAMIDVHRLWWEVALSSKEAVKVLSRRQNKGIGQTLIWEPAMGIDMEVTKGLFSACEEVVERIDHVGLENKGIVEVREGGTSQAPSLTSTTPAEWMNPW